MQKIIIAKLTSIYLKEDNKPIVNKIDPVVISRKNLKLSLYTVSSFFCFGITGEIMINVIAGRFA